MLSLLPFFAGAVGALVGSGFDGDGLGAGEDGLWIGFFRYSEMDRIGPCLFLIDSKYSFASIPSSLLSLRFLTMQQIMIKKHIPTAVVKTHNKMMASVVSVNDFPPSLLPVTDGEDMTPLLVTDIVDGEDMTPLPVWARKRTQTGEN